MLAMKNHVQWPIRLSEKSRRLLFVVICLAPILGYLFLTHMYPILFGFCISFLTYNTVNPDLTTFAGLRNYLRLVADPLFRKAFVNSVKIVLYFVPSTIVISMAIALGLNTLKRARSLATTVYFLPVVTSLVAVSIVWTNLYHPNYGLINQTIKAILPYWGGSKWLGDPNTALLAICIMLVWKSLGRSSVIILAGLQEIPDVYLDAARVDGASGWKLFRYIVLPLLRPVLAFVLVIELLAALQQWVPIFVMTGGGGVTQLVGTVGGPQNSTTTLGLLIYLKGVRELNMSYASAMAFVLFFITLGLSLLQLRLMRSTWEE